MTAFIARRLVATVFVLWGISLLTFVLSHIVPSDPARLLAGPHASASAVARVRAEFGLDKPLPVQYAHYVADLLRGDLGTSFVTLRPVSRDLVSFLPPTLELAVFALLVGAPLGILVGAVGATYYRRAPDSVGRLAAALGLAIPVFWLAMLGQIVFYTHLHWLPFGGQLSTGVTPPPTITGSYVLDSLFSGRFGTFANALDHLVLPGSVLALGVVGMMARITRTSMLEVLGEDYVRTARAKGLGPVRILTHHTLRTALLAPVTLLGLEFGLLAGGVFLVENIFSWPGLGRYAFQAILDSDYNALIAVTLVLAAIYIVANLLVDLVYMLLDPRVRLSG